MIQVTYLCWGCGSTKVKYEPQTQPIPAREVWDLCPDCQRRQRTLQSMSAKSAAKPLRKSGVSERDGH